MPAVRSVAVGVGAQVNRRTRTVGVVVGVVVIVMGVVVSWVVFVAASVPRRGSSDVDVCSHSERPLVRAAGAGDVATVRTLLDRGDDPGQRDVEENTPLGCAIPRGRDEVVELLVSRGADPDGDTGDGPYMEVPLGLAIRRDQGRALDALLRAGADANRRDCKGTPLVSAVVAPRPGMVAALLDHGADPSGSDAGVPLVETARAGNLELTRLLLDRGANPNGVEGARPLVRAASNGEAVIFTELQDRGARLDIVTGGTSTNLVRDDALDLAASNGHLAMVNELLSEGAKPDHDPHLSPLLRSVFYGRHAVTTTLLEHGADPNAGTADDLTLFAIGSGLAGVLPPGAPAPGTTGTQVAASAGPSPQIRALIGANGGDLTSALGGTTPRTSPGTSGLPGTAPRRPDRLADCKDLVALLDDLKEAEGMLDLTRDPSLGRRDTPPVAIALLTRSNEDLMQLLDHGADPNRLALDRFSPLYLSGIDCNVDAARLLLAHGADPNGAAALSRTHAAPTSSTPGSGTAPPPVDPPICQDVASLLPG